MSSIDHLGEADAIERSNAFHDQLAERYASLMGRWRSDQLSRDRFQRQVVAALDPGSRVLDFGCGPGQDASAYAAAGLEVLGYDSSPRMMEIFERELRGWIEEGGVRALQGTYADFLAQAPDLPELQAVTANFAVLTLIPDPAPLLEALTERLATGGLLFVSTLNPFFWREAVFPHRWPAYWHSRRNGVVHLRGEPLDSFRHTVPSIRRLLAPGLDLVSRCGVGGILRHQIAAQVSRRVEPSSVGERLEERFGERFPLNRLGRFFHLTFRKNQ